MALQGVECNETRLLHQHAHPYAAPLQFSWDAAY